MITVPKIVLIILAVIAVWVVFRWLNRAPSSLVRRQRPHPQPQPQTRPAVEDLVACRLCGAYVAPGMRCGKTGCPLPG
jgi:hypothetical protein